MNIINHHFFKRVYQKLTGTPYIISYAQTGEDIIVDFLIGAKKIKEFTYLDIGANHPVKFNNTYKFYDAGYRGVCIEPDPYVYAVLSKKRPEDICLNIGPNIRSECTICTLLNSVAIFCKYRRE